MTLETPVNMVGRMQEGGKPLFPLFGEDGNPGMSGRMGCLTCHDPHAGRVGPGGAGGPATGKYLRDPSGVFLGELCVPCHRSDSAARVQGFHRASAPTE